MRTSLANPCTFTRVITLLFSVCFSASALGATDMPKRKPGLWEINMRMDQAPSMGPMQQCIDKNTDNLMQQEAGKQKHDCSVMEAKTSGNRVTVRSVCKMEGTTATSEGVFEGNFETNYKGQLKTRYNPPYHGMSESTMNQEARWLGPCKAGQKPGDVIMPNMGGMNVQQMMNDPKMQEMMRRQQSQPR